MIKILTILLYMQLCGCAIYKVEKTPSNAVDFSDIGPTTDTSIDFRPGDVGVTEVPNASECFPITFLSSLSAYFPHTA